MVQLSKADVARLGLKAGDRVDVQIASAAAGRIDLSGLPVLGGAEPLSEARKEAADARIARW